MALELVIGIGITIFLLFYLAFNINNNDNGLFVGVKVFLIIMGATMFILIPKANIEAENNVCEVVLANITGIPGDIVTVQQTVITPSVFLSGANCNVTFDDDFGVNVTMNENGALEFYSNEKVAGFTTGGIHAWNVTCAIPGQETLTVSDTIFINNTQFFPAQSLAFVVDDNGDFDNGIYSNTFFNNTVGGVQVQI